MYRSLVRDDAGIALAEGVIVVPFFVLIWMGLVALHLLHGARLAVQVEAGSRVLEMATGGDCGDADMTLDDMPQTAGIDTGLETEQSDLLAEIAGTQPLAWAHATVTASQTVDGIALPFGGPTREVRGTRVLMCNMKPVDGLMELVAGVVQEALGIEDE
jgi:hypothetical protein